MKYWIIEEGRTIGPLTADELRSRGLSGRTPVWRTGLSDWVYIESLPELREINGEVECVTVIEDQSEEETQSAPRPLHRTEVRPQPTAEDDAGAPAPTYLGWSILAALACCTVAGIVAFVFSLRVRDANSRGLFDQARRESDRVEMWLIVSITLGLVMLPFNIIMAML